MIVIKQGDITQEAVDVIVNAANTGLKGGGGVDGAIHRAAGPEVMVECRKLGFCATGDAVMTQAGRLQAKRIIHTVGPVWHGGGQGEADLLKRAYMNSLQLAKRAGFRTIAFPAISTGVYGYPKREASEIALQSGIEFDHDFVEIRFICFSQDDLNLYHEVFRKLRPL